MTQLTINTFLNFTAQELNVPIQNLHEQITFKNIPTWSSLNALLYLARIHNETGVLLSSTELSELNTLRDLFDQIISKQHGV
ncbi:MAG: hypothetical protein LW669_03095 [Sphingobacteriales bacterium]|jgi:hypothetical protein|nr:hypothetical protein [Sphingobacteriales bacterium]